ncbi:MAG TPA: tetratricopeptide repeat protein [Verrucomicrobiae bacterium]|nr:tetratricopeptide repeat protein [Verrucomicrobiae bacterium]
MLKDAGSDEAPSRLLPVALAFVALVTLAAYWPVLGNGFIDYDDPLYVTGNEFVRRGLTWRGAVWAFTSVHAGNWHPLTWLSHMLDIQLFGLDPAGHHATALLLHTANSVLLCVLLYRLSGFTGRSLFAALLFAIHPLHVESVAWISERKDVLSTLFWLLTMWAYAGYARSRSAGRYPLMVVVFTLGLMAKQMLVTLPLVLLLLDWWPLRRLPSVGIRNLLMEKVPLLALSAAASLLTLRAQSSAGAVTGGFDSIFIQVGNALISYVKYLGKMFFPVNLALFYPFEPADVTAVKVAGAAAFLALVTWWALAQRNERPYLLFGWLWYLVTLLPVIGFIRIGQHAVADRYTYVPLIGIFIILAWGAADISARYRHGSRAAAAVAAAVVLALSVLTAGQVRYWNNSYDLYTHALAVTERNWMAHNNLGILLSQHQRHGEAIEHFRESVRHNPKDGTGYRNLGNALQATGRPAEAIEAFRMATTLNPGDVEAHHRLGYAYLMSGNRDLAYQEYLQLTRLHEGYAKSLLDSIRMSIR